MSTGSSRSAYARRDLTLPESLRDTLKQPLGPVRTGKALVSALAGVDFVVAVGDYCAADLVKRGVAIRVAVIDRKTKRRASNAGVAVLRDYHPVTLANPAGRIVKAAWTVLGEAFKSGGRVRVEVNGEEDLLALPAIALAPPGAAVVYGQPDEGAVVVAVDAAVKRRVQRFLSRMV